MGVRRDVAKSTGTGQKVGAGGGADAVYYSRWFNEDALVNQRLTWLLLAQGLLFAAYGTLATKAVDACDDKATYLFSVLGLISAVGQIFAVLIFSGIGAAVCAQWILHDRYAAPKDPIGVHTATTIVGWLTGLFVPVVFFGAWLYVPEPDVARVAANCRAAAIAAPVAPPAPAASPTGIGTESGPAGGAGNRRR